MAREVDQLRRCTDPRAFFLTGRREIFYARYGHVFLFIDVLSPGACYPIRREIKKQRTFVSLVFSRCCDRAGVRVEKEKSSHSLFSFSVLFLFPHIRPARINICREKFDNCDRCGTRRVEPLESAGDQLCSAITAGVLPRKVEDTARILGMEVVRAACSKVRPLSDSLFRSAGQRLWVTTRLDIVLDFVLSSPRPGGSSYLLTKNCEIEIVRNEPARSFSLSFLLPFSARVPPWKVAFNWNSNTPRSRW